MQREADKAVKGAGMASKEDVEELRGQIAEIDLLPAERLDWANYVEAATGKTGALFSLPVVGIAILVAVIGSPEGASALLSASHRGYVFVAIASVVALGWLLVRLGQWGWLRWRLRRNLNW